MEQRPQLISLWPWIQSPAFSWLSLLCGEDFSSVSPPPLLPPSSWILGWPKVHYGISDLPAYPYLKCWGYILHLFWAKPLPVIDNTSWAIRELCHNCSVNYHQNLLVCPTIHCELGETWSSQLWGQGSTPNQWHLTLLNPVGCHCKVPGSVSLQGTLYIWLVGKLKNVIHPSMV